MRLNYKYRLFLWFVVIFATFAVGVVLFERSRERRQKTEMLELELDAYARIADAALARGGEPSVLLDSLALLLPDNLRLTCIAPDGAVVYDNSVATTENHASRPEVAAARERGAGTAIRTSATTNRAYLYYARRFGDRYIRVALPYDLTLQGILKADNYFLYFVIALFAAMLVTVNYVSGRFGRSIRQLRDFTVAARDETHELPTLDFPADELGEAGARITESYRQLRESRQAVAAEREKLLQHVHSSEEGICFFSAGRRVEFYNGLFIQYLNTIADHSAANPSALFSDPAFNGLFEQGGDRFRQVRIDRHGRHFLARVNLFEDASFEVIINDVTGEEKTRLLKHEMTGNIAHELRTPVTTVRGYLETMLSQPLDADRQRQFLKRAYDQTIALSDLIRDMSLITKIEEVPASFSFEPVAIAELLESLRTDLEPALRDQQMAMEWNVPPGVVVGGNRSLVYSIFRNLADNAIRYAGHGTEIRIGVYNEDERSYYFSFADNGAGIPDERHLGRLFERFYRIGEGRTRDTGGTGLGLSIVRNAIALHRGTISVKNAVGGGLEFLFTLPK